jgi:thiol:disulfide interchange protein DsbA
MPISQLRRRLTLALCASPALLAAPALRAQAPFIPEEGVNFTSIPRAQPTDTPGKIEVLDFFWYGCPHCYAFLPDLEAWRKRLAPDVAYKHAPVDFGDPGREPHSRIFATLQALGKVDELHVKVFEAYHVQRKRLVDPNEVADFMAANGIPREQWLATYNSFSVANMVNRERLKFQSFGIDSTPWLGIDGRFVTAPTLNVDQANPNRATLATADFLIERVRRERSRGKKS